MTTVENTDSQNKNQHSIHDPIKIHRYVINTDRSGEIHAVVQGDLSQQEKRAVFMTVHDLGCNHSSFQEFVNSPCMTEIKERSCFIHIDVPGHADNAATLPES
jgi:hypothetical protein